MKANAKPAVRDLSRRSFLRTACCAAVGSTGLLSALAQLRAIGAVAADAATPTSDYKALVCLFLNGGNDANNVIIPASTADYNLYASSRGSLALPSSNLLPIGRRYFTDGRSYALHPSLPEVQNLYNQGRLAFLANVGTLVQPTTLAQYSAGTALPPQLFSHSDQQVQWQSSVPDQPFRTGWGGRVADAVNAMNENNQISMSISLYGANSFQVGNTVTQLAVNADGVSTLAGYDSGGNYGQRYAGVKNLLSQTEADLFATAFSQVAQTSIASSEILSTALQNAPALQTVFPGNSIADQLQMVAKLISVAPALGLKRQVFFCQLYGWDLHGAQLEAQAPLLTEISAALAAFDAATTEMGVTNQVTTFTASDFGRTYTSNGDGSDHGWGSHHLIMGGAVQGGDIYGTMPSLQVGGPDDVGRGRWLPTTSVDQYSATLANWFGVSATNLPTVLPNLGRFGVPNLGFLG
jgi:uncharacterized protein (DUF1501 family)